MTLGHLTFYSPNPQQSMRIWRPFANNNNANAHKASNEKESK